MATWAGWTSSPLLSEHVFEGALRGALVASTVRAVGKWIRILVAVGVASVAWASVAAPGRADVEPGAIDLGTIREVTKRMEEAGSARYRGRVTVTPSTQDYYEFEVDGAVDYASDLTAWTATGRIGLEGRTRVVVEGDDTYVSWGRAAGSTPLPKGKRWVHFAPDDGAFGGPLTGPRRSVEFVDQPGLELRVVGDAEVNGIQATRVHLQWSEELASAVRPNGYVVPAEPVVQRVDLWLDSEGRLVRESSVIVVRAGSYDVSRRTLMDYSAYGKPVRLRAPAADEVVDADAVNGGAAPLV